MKNEISLSPFPGDTSPPNTSREPCGERNVVGAVGRAVTLRVTYTGTRSIIWSFDEKSDNLATTRPGGSLDILDPQYDGRLSGSSDGSLIITNLQHEDQGTYRARIIKNVSQYCVYHLYVINVRSQEPCGERNVTGAVGGAVTLHVTYTGTRIISWTFGDKGDIIATIVPGRSPEIQDKRYFLDGRLNSSSDGSLTITNLQHEDQGTYRAQNLDLKCSYHLSVFRNLTDENITISYNVTDNTTCEMIFTCSVNSAKKSNVTVTWRIENRGDISPPTENVVLVPPSHNHLTYICTATNPVSSASKSVLPGEYCERNDTSEETPNHRTRIAIIVAVVILIFIIIIIVVFGIVRQKRSGSISGSQQRIPSTKEPNPYEFNDEEGAACPAARGDKEQKPGKDRNKQNNVKGKQEPSVCVVTTVYDEVRPLQNGESPNVSRPAQSKEKGAATMYKNPQATESKESPSEVDNGNTLYSTVQHVKGKNGKQSKAPKGAVSNPPPESCYATVQLPMVDRNGRKMSSEGGNTTAPEESCYEKVQHPTDKNNPKIPPIPANWGPPKATQRLPNKPTEPSKVTEPAKDPRTL